MVARVLTDRTGLGARGQSRWAVAGALLVLATCVGARAEELCVVASAAVPGISPESLDAALAVEAMKARRQLGRKLAEAPEACGGGDVLVLDGLVIRLRGQGRAEQLWRASELDPSDPAQDLARRVVGALCAVAVPDPVVEGDVSWRVPPGAATRRASTIGLAGFVSAGGLWEFQQRPGLHFGGIDMAAGIALMGERVAIGARAGWQATEGPGGFRVAQVQEVPVMLWTMAGPRLGPLLLRAGAGVGLEWRRVRFGKTVATGQRVATDLVPMLGGEAEASVVVPPGIRVGVAGFVRGFLSGEAYTWAGAASYDPPRVSGGLAVRTGFAFPGRGR